MKNKVKTINKGFRAFNTLYIIGIIFAGTKMIDYLQWTFQLVKKWSLPTDPFFSNINIVQAEAEMSVITYLVLAIAYILVFGFIFLGLYQLNRTIKLFSEKQIFQEEISIAFKKAGKSFLYFAYGTFLVDVASLACSGTNSRLMDMLSTELLVFLIVGYFMLFMADIFKEGLSLKMDKELTN